MYSFEIKRELNFTNLREAFFQTVSNSSWAHEGYLAAAEIDTDEEFREELGRLSASFGIGIIQLDIEDPESSQILFFSEKADKKLDWDTLNKLANNADVKHLIKHIKNNVTTNEIVKEFYDCVLGPEELLESIRQLKQP